MGAAGRVTELIRAKFDWEFSGYLGILRGRLKAAKIG